MTLSRLDRAAMRFAYLTRSAEPLALVGVDTKSSDVFYAYHDAVEGLCDSGHWLLTARLALFLRVLLREEGEAYVQRYAYSRLDPDCVPKRYRCLWELAPSYDPSVTPKMRREAAEVFSWPIEKVDDELRRMGIDPDRAGDEGERFCAELIERFCAELIERMRRAAGGGT